MMEMNRRHHKTRLIGATLAILASLLLAACGGSAATSAPASSAARPSAPSGRTSASEAASSAPVSAKPSSASVSAPAGGLRIIRIALSSSSPSNAGVYIADSLGYLQKQGIQLQYLNFNNASEIAPALINNQVDVADVGINPAMFNTLTAGLGSKLVADKGSQPKGFGFTALVVRKDLAGKIKGPADLKGINLAMTPPGLGTANGFALGAYLAQAHLTPQDLHIQPLAFAAQPAALSNKAVDAAIMAEPFVTQAVKNGLGVRLIGLDQMVPGQQVAGLAYSSQFISQHRDLGQKFMVAYVQALRYYDDAFEKGLNKDKVIGILAQKTAVKDKQLWAEMVPAGLNRDGKLNKESIQAAEDFFQKLGLIKSAPPLSSFVDDSFVGYADKELGPSS